MTTRPSDRFKEPPDHLSDDVAQVWRDVVGSGQINATVDAAMLEAYATLIHRWREAAKVVGEEGLVVDGGNKGAIAHPALAAERALADQIKTWAPLIRKPDAARRRRGPLYDETRRSIAATKQLREDDMFAGPVEAVLTLAWLIDEAQRAGIEAMQRASFVMIPSYLKGCAELQITPASVPEKPAGVDGGGKVTKFADAAAARRKAANG